MTRDQTHCEPVQTGIPTEPAGSVPRPRELQETMTAHKNGQITDETLDTLLDDVIRETIERYEATGSPIVSDGEQPKPSFISYPFEDLDNLDPNGFVLSFADGHKRQLPVLTRGPFRYATYAGSYLLRARKFATRPLKESVISASAMSMLYPETELPGYSRKQFLDDVVREAVADIRSCFDNGACRVMVDFTEGRLAVKIDPTRKLLQDFIDLNNRVFAHFTTEERQCIGIHTCPGADRDSTHSADVDYRELIPMLLTLNADNFFMQMASERNPEASLKTIREHLRPHQRIYVGVIDPINEEIESPETVRDRVLRAAEYIPLSQLGTTDDCGFSPFSDDIATSRETAFAKISARIQGTKLAYDQLCATAR